MTVTTELYQSGWMAWTGVETVFAPGFSAAALDDLKVEFRSAALVVITLVRGVHYSAALAAGSNSVTVTPFSPTSLPPAPGSLRITRKTPALQAVNFANLGGFDAGVHTRLHDAAAMRDAELSGRVGVLEGTIAAPVVPPIDPTTITHHLDTRTAITTTTFDASVSWVKTAGCLAVGDGGHGVYKREGVLRPGGVTSVDGAKWTLVENAPNFYQFGAVGDGVADDYPAVSACNDYAQLFGAVIESGSGAFKLDMSVALRPSIVLDHVVLRGAGAKLWESGASPAANGTWFVIVGTVASPFSLRNCVDFSDVTFFWPQQVSPTVPIAYPYAIDSVAPIFCNVFRVNMINAYHGINIASPNGYNRIEHCKITAFKNAIRGDQASADLHVMFNTFSYGIGYNYYNSLGVLAAFIDAIAYGGSVGVNMPGAFYDDWHIDNNGFFALTDAVLVSHTGGSDAYMWGSISNNLLDACLRAISFGGVSVPRPVVINGNVISGQISGTSFAGANIQVASTSTGAFELIVDGNQMAGGKASTVAVTAPNLSGGSLVTTSNTFKGMGLNGNIGSLNFALYVNAAALDVVFNSNRVDGTVVNAVIKRAVEIAGAKSLLASTNNLASLDVGFNVSGTISGNLILGVNNAAASVVTAYAIPGAVSGISKGTTSGTNSWN